MGVDTAAWGLAVFLYIRPQQTNKQKMEIEMLLKWLLEKYQQEPNGVYDISHAYGPEVEKSHVHEQGKFLASKGFIKNHSQSEMGFYCSISSLGIIQISNLFEDNRFRLLHASIEQRKRSVTEILGIAPAHFKIALDCASYFKKLGLIEYIVHSNDILAEATYFGREWYQEQKLKLNT